MIAYFFIISNRGRYEIIGRLGFRSTVDERGLVVSQHGELLLVQLVVVESVSTRAVLGHLIRSIAISERQSLIYVMILFLFLFYFL